MKFFAVFFIALVAIHASTQSPITDDDPTTKQVIVELLKDTLKITSALLSSIKTLLEEFKANEKTDTEGLANLLAKRLQAVNDAFVEVIDELKDGATDQGKHVLGCIDAEQEKVDAAILKTALTLADNTLTEIPLLTDLVDVILSQSSELQEDVQLLVDTLETCDSTDTICLALFAASATKIIKEAVENGQEDVDALITVVKAIVTDVQAWDIAGTIRDDIQDVFNDVVVCIYS